MLGHGVVQRPAGDACRTADSSVLAGRRGGGRSSHGVDHGRCNGAAVTGRKVSRTVGLAAGRRTVSDVGQTATKHLYRDHQNTTLTLLSGPLSHDIASLHFVAVKAHIGRFFMNNHGCVFTRLVAESNSEATTASHPLMELISGGPSLKVQGTTNENLAIGIKFNGRRSI